ncbi:hypothetical protein GCM10020255_070840 [Rhodococcus baikonurensis]
MIVETVREFAAEILRPAAYDADGAAQAPADLSKRAAELGITLINVPEELDGAAADRGAVTNSLVAEALAHGDMGLALPILAPSGVAVALTQWGTDAQQKTYLPAFTGEQVPGAAVVVNEPRALFDPFALQTKAVRSPAATSSTASRAWCPPPLRPNSSSSPQNSTASRPSSSSNPTPRDSSSKQIPAWVCAPPVWVA